MNNIDHTSLISIRNQYQNTHLRLFFNTVACYEKILNMPKTLTSVRTLPHFRYKGTHLVILKSIKLNISVMLTIIHKKTLPAKTEIIWKDILFPEASKSWL